VHLGTKQQDGEEDAKKRIEQTLGTKRMQADEIAAKTGIPYSTVKKRLDSMKAEARVGSVPGTGTGSPHLWFTLTAESPVSKSLAPTTKMEN
jgi:predicted ArsR family transcriptional regulator